VVVGLVGFFGLIGPTSDQSIFGSIWWFDNGENWAHLVLGVVALLLAFYVSESLQKQVTMVLGVVGLLIGLYSLFGYTSFLGANLQNPADSVLHLAIGAWALWASMGKGGS